MTEPEKAIVVVGRWEKRTIAASTHIPCARCHADCAISPATLQAAKSHPGPVEYVCWDCTSAAEIAQGDVAITKGQIVEFLNHRKAAPPKESLN